MVLLFHFPFPRRGGGWGRRAWRIWRDRTKLVWTTPLLQPYSPLRLFDFTDPHDAADARVVGIRDLDGWRVSDDGVIGGYSTCQANFVTTTPPPPSTTIVNQEDSSSSFLDTNNNIPYLRWEGNVDTTVGLESKSNRSGFAALRSPIFRWGGVDLKAEFDGLEIVCRTDGRIYTVNLTVESLLPNDVYQTSIDSSSSSSSKHGKFQKIFLPFAEFGSGYRRLEKEVCIEAIGFTILGGQQGPFQFDLAKIRAVNLTDDHKVFEGPVLLK